MWKIWREDETLFHTGPLNGNGFVTLEYNLELTFFVYVENHPITFGRKRTLYNKECSDLAGACRNPPNHLRPSFWNSYQLKTTFFYFSVSSLWNHLLGYIFNVSFIYFTVSLSLRCSFLSFYNFHNLFMVSSTIFHDALLRVRIW